MEDTVGTHPIQVPPLSVVILTREVLNSITKVDPEEAAAVEEVLEEVEVEEAAAVVTRPTLRQHQGSKRLLSLRYVPYFYNCLGCPA